MSPPQDDETSLHATFREVMAKVTDRDEVKGELRSLSSKVDKLEHGLEELKAEVVKLRESLASIAASLALLVQVARHPATWAIIALIFGGPEVADIVLGSGSSEVPHAQAP